MPLHWRVDSIPLNGAYASLGGQNTWTNASFPSPPEWGARKNERPVNTMSVSNNVTHSLQTPTDR